MSCKSRVVVVHWLEHWWLKPSSLGSIPGNNQDFLLFYLLYQFTSCQDAKIKQAHFHSLLIKKKKTILRWIVPLISIKSRILASSQGVSEVTSNTPYLPPPILKCIVLVAEKLEYFASLTDQYSLFLSIVLSIYDCI